jgi:hypothetical protein
VGTGALGITTDYYAKVSSTKELKVGGIFRLETTGMTGWILAVTRGVSNELVNGYVKFRLLRAYTIVATTEYDAGVMCRVVGSAYGEGAAQSGLGSLGFKRPVAIMNTTQIIQNQFEFPGSVLEMGLKYDDTGPYQERARDEVINHMTSIERTLIWGKRSTTSRASFDTSQESLSVRTTSGILEFLELWDAGATGLSIDGATYAPYNFKSAATLDSDDTKRVIANADGYVTVDRFNDWAERVGRYHHNRSNEKLVLMGSTALKAFVKMFRMNSSFQVRYGEKAYGLNLVTLTTPFGDFHLVTHPLFNEDTYLRSWAMILDIWSLKYRPLGKRDTRLLKMQQNPGDDFRRDKYLTEFGIEFWQPEGNMVIKNIQDYSE